MLSPAFSTLEKSGSGQIRHRWEEADSLLPETPVRSFDISQTQIGDTRRARLSLFASHFLSTWGIRQWEFAVSLLMLEIYPSSLLLVSIFGLVDAATLVFFSPLTGAYVDSTPRLQAATRMYLLQNVSVAISALSGLLLLWRGVDASHNGMYWMLAVISIGTGALSSLGAAGASLSVEREWVKTLSGNDSDALASMNATMKRIDLTCLIISPILVGLLMSYWKMDKAIIFLIIWNASAWLPECLLLKRAQLASPILNTHHYSNTTTSMGTPPSNNNNNNNVEISKDNRSILHHIRYAFSGWSLYLSQPAILAALSLALLYFTVLSFGSLMTAFLKWHGMGESELSIYRGLGAVSGIAATLLFPWLHSKFGLVVVGAGAIWAQFLCLAGGSLPLILKKFGLLPALSASGALHILVSGLILSRCGLWGFDLAVNQILQTTVPSNTLGSVTGVQNSLQSLCQMLIYVSGVVVVDPSKFVFLIAGSACVVGSAAVMFSMYALHSGCWHGGLSSPPQDTPLTP